jgi:hypothetical protein
VKKKILLVARQGERERGADDEEGFVCGRGGSPGRALNAGDFHLLPATRRRRRRVAWERAEGGSGFGVAYRAILMSWLIDWIWRWAELRVGMG